MSATGTIEAFTLHDLQAALEAPANPTRWRCLFGMPVVGSGNRLTFTLGHIVTARALRGWFEETGRGSARTSNIATGSLIARAAPRLIDEGNPPYVVHHRSVVSPFFTAEAIVFEAAHGPVHVIDVRAITAEVRALGASQ